MTRSQEKNRKAQARFRERQKVKDAIQRQRLADLELSVQALANERVELAAQRADLKEQCRLLSSNAQLIEDIRQDTSAFWTGQESKAANTSQGPLHTAHTLPAAMPPFPPLSACATHPERQSIAAAAFSLPKAPFAATHIDEVTAASSPLPQGFPQATAHHVVPVCGSQGGAAMTSLQNGSLAANQSVPSPSTNAWDSLLLDAGPGGLQGPTSVADAPNMTDPRQSLMEEQLSAHSQQGIPAVRELVPSPSVSTPPARDTFEIALPGEDVPNLKWNEFCQFYKDRIFNIGTLLPVAKTDASSNEACMCKNLLRDLSIKYRAIFHRDPLLRSQIHTQPIMTPHDPSFSRKPDRKLWQGVVETLQLSRAQQHDTLQLQRHFLQCMMDIMSQRRILADTILSSCGRTLLKAEDVASVHCSSNQGFADGHSMAMQAVDELRQNLADETMAQIQAGSGLMHKVLSPIQACSVFVGVYPWFPDKVAMMDCIVEAATSRYEPPACTAVMPAGMLEADHTFVPAHKSTCRPSTLWKPPLTIL